MTDRELLELAAKAVGFEFNPMWCDAQTGLLVWEPPTNYESRDWNPLTDDGDALRLAVGLGLVVDCSRPSAGPAFQQHAIWLDDLMSTAELTRRAIVRAAAEIEKGK